MKSIHELVNHSKLWIESIYLIIGILFINPVGSFSQTCPNMSTYCATTPLICGSAQLNNSTCSLVDPNNYSGDNCNQECGFPDNQVYYAFVTNGEGFDVSVTYTNCAVVFPNGGSGVKGLRMGIFESCCGEMLVGCTAPPQDTNWTVSTSTLVFNAPVPCKIYYLMLDGLYGSYCDYTINTNGGASNVPLVLKNINNVSNNIIDLKRGACNYKFTVEPRDQPCEGYYQWTIDGTTIDDHDREIKLDFPNEGDFEVCVYGYIGLPDLNCGQSNVTCTTVKVRQEHRTADTRYLCNELRGFKWHKQIINTSGNYTQEFQEKCHIFDSTIEFVLLLKPQSGIINYISCSKSDPYFDPVFKDYYRYCTKNKKILISKSTEIYACDSSYLLNVAYVDLKNKFHLTCKNGNVYMIPETTDFTDTCGIGVTMDFNYAWYEKINNQIVFIAQGNELKITKKGNYQLQVIANYTLGAEAGNCIVAFDEDIDEDSYLTTPNTGSLNGKIQVCKADIECYSINDIVRNPFSFTWSVDQGTIITPNPDTSKRICVQWDKNSTMTHGKICATYSDSCSSNLKACLDIEFGKSQKDVAGPNQKVQGVLGTRMNAQGKKGLWTFAGGPGTVTFTDPTDPKSKVRVSRFGAYEFKWTTIEGDCEVYGFVTVNFFIEFAELEGEYFKHFYNLGEKGSDFNNIQSRYENDQLNIQGELTNPSRIHFQIINIQGQILYSDEMQTTESTFFKTINLELFSGIYYLVLKNNAEYKINKFIVFE